MTMEKKKITPEDLDLNIEVTGGNQLSSRFTETRTCNVTRNQTCNAEECETATTKPTVPECKTVAEAGCRQTDACWTIEPECETKVGCQDSNSHAQLCCPITNQNGCKDTVDNCASVDTCGANTVKICLETSNGCVNTRHNCLVSQDNDETCGCINTIQETCEPPKPATIFTGCDLC